MLFPYRAIELVGRNAPVCLQKEVMTACVYSFAGDGDSVLSKYSLFVRGVHAVLTTSLHVLRHERYRAVHSAVSACHGRLLSAAGRPIDRTRFISGDELNGCLWCLFSSLMPAKSLY